MITFYKFQNIQISDGVRFSFDLLLFEFSPPIINGFDVYMMHTYV